MFDQGQVIMAQYQLVPWEKALFPCVPMLTLANHFGRLAVEMLRFERQSSVITLASVQLPIRLGSRLIS